MGNPSYIQVSSNFSNIKTIPDVVRYLSALAQTITSEFNSLVGNKDVYGGIGNTGFIGFTGTGNYGVSFVSTGTYYLGFREAFAFPPSVVMTAASAAVICSSSGVTTSGFTVLTHNTSAALVNAPFHFHVKGARV